MRNLTLGIFCNKPFKAFLEVQMFKVKPIPVLAIKNYSFDAAAYHFFTKSTFFVQCLFSTSVTASHNFKSFITVFKEKS